MPIILIFFILFIIWVNVKTKRGATDNSKWDTSYWEKEREANFVRKKDISNLDYITISEDELPFSDTAGGEEKYWQDEVRRTLSCKILNLSGMSNADIKLAYGTANFPELSMYDQNYILLIRNLGLWGSYLHHNCEGQDTRAKIILERALSLGSDIKDTYVSLAEIYLAEHHPEKVQELIRQVEASDFDLKDSLLRALNELLPD